MGLLDGKTALITGASRGIGKGIAEKFAAEGANIAFTYRSSEEKAKALEAELGKLGIKAMGFKSDASSFEESAKLIEDVTANFESLDIVVNNAGITKDNLILRMSEDQWDDVINVNLKSVFNLTKHVSRTMMKQRSGSIINMSSVVGVFGQAGQSNYSASKSGIFGFTKSIAKELASRGIRCNAVAPGFIDTEMTQELTEEQRAGFLQAIPLGRYASTEEVANVCLFLAGDQSSYVTGQTISVCGGLNC